MNTKFAHLYKDFVGFFRTVETDVPGYSGLEIDTEFHIPLIRPNPDLRTFNRSRIYLELRTCPSQ